MQPAVTSAATTGGARKLVTTALSGRSQPVVKSMMTLESGKEVELQTSMFPGTEVRGDDFNQYIPKSFVEDEVHNFYRKTKLNYMRMGKPAAEVQELVEKATPPPVTSEWVNYMNAYMLQLVPNYSLYPFNLPDDICDSLPEFVDPRQMRVEQAIVDAEKSGATAELNSKAQMIVDGESAFTTPHTSTSTGNHHIGSVSNLKPQSALSRDRKLEPLISFSPGAVLLPETRDVFIHSSSFNDVDGIYDYWKWMSKKVGVFSPCFLRYNAVSGKILPVHMQPQNSAELFHTVATIDAKDTGIHYMSPKLGFHALYVPHSALDVWEWPFHPDRVESGPVHMLQNKKTDELYYHLTEISRPHRVLGNIACKTHLHPILSLGNIGKMTDRDRGFIRHETRHDCQILRGRILAPPVLTEKLNQLIVNMGYRSMYWVPESLIAEECKQLIRGTPHKLSYLLGARVVEDRFYNQDQFPPCEDSFEWSWSRLYGKAKEAIEFESRFRLEMEMTGTAPPL